MLNQFSRTQLLYGKEAMEKLKNSCVAIFGLGGVGGYVGEALARSGIGSFDLIDDDKICLTNLNRQIIATFDTVGQYKTDVMKERMLKINPKVNIQTHQCFFLPENASDFSFEDYDYIIDAMNTVESKLLLIENAKISKTPIISCMSTDDRMDPSKLEIVDISRSVLCPIAKQIRTKLRKKGIRKVKVLSSREKISDIQLHGSISFMPGAAGMMLAGVVVKDLLGKSDRKHRYKK